MPLDNVPVRSKRAIRANLIKARSLIEDPNHHLMGNFRKRHPVYGVQRCSMQAIADVLEINAGSSELPSTPEMKLLSKASGSESYWGVCGANNLGHASALAMFDKAIAATKGK